MAVIATAAPVSVASVANGSIVSDASIAPFWNAITCCGYGSTVRVTSLNFSPAFASSFATWAELELAFAAPTIAIPLRSLSDLYFPLFTSSERINNFDQPNPGGSVAASATARISMPRNTAL